MYVCECGRIFEKANSLNAHFSHCLIHRNGKEPIDRFKNSRAWNKGLTKNNDERVKRNAEKNSGINHPFYGRHLSKKHRDNISKSVIGKTGGYREGCNKWKGEYIFFNNEKIWLDSSWEKIFVESLISKNIKWIKNQGKWGFKYEFKKRIYTYYPDFFLPEFDLWIEIKGLEKEKDKFKWNQFPAKLKILKNLNEINSFNP